MDGIVTVLIFVLMTVLFMNGTFQSLDWKLFDSFMKIHRSTPEKKNNVAIICIDQVSLEFFIGNSNSWPWPRDFYAILTEYLAGCGAKAILYDAIFSDPDIERTGSKGIDNDTFFGEAISESGRTYLVADAQPGFIPENQFNQSIFLPDYESFGQFNFVERKSAVFPLPLIAHGAKGIGLSNAINEDDGVFRRYILAMRLHDRYMPSLGFLLARDILGEDGVMDLLFETTGKSDLLDTEGKLLLNWYGASDPENGPYRYHSFHAVIASMQQVASGETPIIPQDAFKDKIIIIGSNAPGLLDLKSTPMTTMENPYPGMEIHATAIENFLGNDFIRRMSSMVVIALMAAGAVVMFALFKLIKGIRLYVAAFIVFIAVDIVLAYWLLTGNIWLQWIEVFATTTFTFAGLVISGYFSESKDKKILRRTFERYVSDSVLERIFENPDVVDFEGRDITATVMATDIQGFTSISENLPAHEVVSRLNDYLSEVSESLIDNGGFINKYIGDAILAVFGAFGDKNHQQRACIAGLEAMMIIEQKINEAENLGLTPFITRMGVTTGDLTMGNIGSARKLEFTVIGDTVNTAFRLEGINKYYNTRFLLSEFTKAGAGDGFEFRLIDSLRFKGKDTAVKVYEILGREGEVSTKKLRQRDEFEDALAFYCEGNFTRAHEIFSKLTAEGDPPADVLKLRCETYLKEPPGHGWTGVWTMFSK